MSKDKILPPGIFLIFILAMWAVDLLAPVKQLFTVPVNYIGVFFIVDGLTLVLWAARLFDRNDTAIKPFMESSVLVTEGPYQFTRNPMYLGMTGMLLGVAMVLGSLLPLVLPVIFVKIIEKNYVIPEEEMMEAKFGDHYREYKKSVRRWI